MKKTYSVATYTASHTTPYMVIIVKPESGNRSWVLQVQNTGDHNGLMRLVSNLDLNNHRTAELLA